VAILDLLDPDRDRGELHNSVRIHADPNPQYWTIPGQIWKNLEDLYPESVDTVEIYRHYHYSDYYV